MSADLLSLVNQLRSTLGTMEIALGAIADAIVWTDDDGTIQWCNTAFDRLVDRSHVLVLSSKFSEVLPLTQAGSAIDPQNYPNVKVLQGEYIVTEYEFERDGRLIILEISGSCATLKHDDSGEALDNSCLAVLVIRDVTEVRQIAVRQQRTEAALRQSELRFQAFFDNAAVGAVLARADGLTLQANPALQQALGYSEAELQTMRFSDYTHPDDLARSVEFRQQVFSGERASSQLEKRYVRKDGSVFWGRLTLNPIRDAEGNTQFMLALIEDINERKQAEEALQQSESRYRALVTATAQSVFTTNADGEVVDDIPLWCALTGRSEAEGKGFGWLETVHPDDRESTMQAWSEAYRTKTLCEIEQRVQVASGEYRLFLVRGVPILDEQGNVREWVGTQTDITDRHQAEEALRLSEQKYRNLFENSQVGIGRSRLEDGLFLDANQRCAEILGFDSPADIIGHYLQNLSQDLYVNPDERQHIIDETQQHGERRSFELRLRRRNGTEAWVLLSFQRNQTSDCLDFVMTDISARKQAEAALYQREQEFRTLVENVPATIIRFDRHSRYLFINSQVERETGIPPAEFLGKTVAEMGFPEEIATRWQGILDHVFQTAQDYEAELELPLSGRLTYQSFRVVPELNHDGTVASVLAVVRDITEAKQREVERKHLEAKLLRSQQFLDSVIENIPLGLFVKDVTDEFRFVLINRFAEPFLGFTREAAIGRNDYELSSFEQSDYYRQQDIAAIQQGTLVTSEQPVMINGQKRLERVLKVPIVDAQNQATHLLCICEDITERKQREEALQLIVEGTAATTSEQFFRSFVEYLAKVMQVRYALVTEFADAAHTRVRTLAVWQGDAIAPNFDYNPSGTPCDVALNGELQDICFYSENVQVQFPDDLDLVALEGESYLGIPLIDSSGQVLGHVAVIDVNPMPHDPGRELILRIFAARASAELERKQIDDALQRRAEADSLLSQISRQFIDQDADTAINFTLQAIAQAIGAERSCIFGLAYKPQSYGYLIHEWHVDGIDYIPDHIKAANLDDFPMFKQLLNGNAFQISCVATLPTDAPEQALLQPIGIQSAVVVPMIHLDKVVGYLTADVVHWAKTWSQEDINLMSRIAEVIAIAQARYQAEEALRVAKDAAEAANRAKSTFLANMSHELRTPLNAILGFAQLMQRDPVLTPRQQGSLATINRSGEHLLNLINDVLEMSKIEAGRTVLNPVSFDLHRLLQTLQEIFQQRASAKRLSLQFEQAENLPQYVSTDEGKLRQVLINLLSNAVKFTEVGGVVVRSSRSITHSLPNDEITLRFEVEDTGTGIAANEVKQLFQPFVQTVNSERSAEGTGLGLAISRQFVRLLGGEISLRSVVGQGTLFYFTVQAKLVTPVEVATPRDARQVLSLAPNQPTYRILAVDDRPENLDLIVQLLDQVGFETRSAINGEDAIVQWQTWKPHLIWMDMRMPGMDGYEATRRIRAIEGSAVHTVIVALTASAFDEQKATILAAGCDDMVSKPFKSYVIFDKLAEHLGVQYLYEPESSSPLLKERIEDLNPASLKIMPDSWIAELYQAAVIADSDRIFQLIEQIPPNHSEIAQQLTVLVQQFDFDQILALTEIEND